MLMLADFVAEGLLSSLILRRFSHKGHYFGLFICKTDISLWVTARNSIILTFSE